MRENVLLGFSFLIIFRFNASIGSSSYVAYVFISLMFSIFLSDKVTVCVCIKYNKICVSHNIFYIVTKSDWISFM